MHFLNRLTMDSYDILHEIKVSNLNRDIHIKQRQINLYERVYKIYKLTGRRINKQYIEDITEELTFFKYLTNGKLSYVSRLGREHSGDNNYVNYTNNNVEEQKHSSFTNYSPSDMSYKEANRQGEFGVIMAEKTRPRGRPSNVFKKINTKMNNSDRYQQLSFEECRNNVSYENQYDYHYKNPGTIDEHEGFYQRSEYNYAPVDYEVQNEFQRTYNSWSNLYKSMSNTVNHNENYYENNENDINYPIEKNNYNTVYNNNDPICAHCDATETSLWRRLDGNTVCNACGLYFKMHGVRRPKTLKKYAIKKRRRTGKRNSRAE